MIPVTDQIEGEITSIKKSAGHSLKNKGRKTSQQRNVFYRLTGLTYDSDLS
jgi:hypothetical protein